MEQIPNLSEVERLLLSNQFRIRAAIEPDNSEQLTQYADILQAGHVGLYGHMFDTLSAGTSEQDLEEMDAIVTMFNFIDNALAELTPEQKAKLDLNRLRFEGFDANAGKHHSLLKFMMEKMDSFSELDGRNINSHTSSSLPRYLRMVAVYEPLRRESSGPTLSFEDLQKIAAA